MNRKLAVFIGLSFLLSFIQITLDYKDILQNRQNIVEAAKPDNYVIFIEIEDNTLYLLQDNKCVKSYPIASGKSGWPSPLGFWKIVEKDNWGEGFGGYWLGLNVTWGKYGIHGTSEESSIGTYSSHGCIRMYNRDVEELFNTVPIGTPVVVVNGVFGPFGRGFYEINPGDRGADVLAIQQRLKELGYFNGYPSGIYEDDLKLALHKFQKDKKLPVTNTITKQAWLKMGFREFE